MLLHCLPVLIFFYSFTSSTATSPVRNDQVCPYSILKETIENLSCNGSAYACALEARQSAQHLHTNATSTGFAWGAVVMRSGVDMDGLVSWSLQSQPSTWHCSAKTPNGWRVILFRTGARFVEATRDHWWWYSTHHQDMCPISVLRAYFSQMQVQDSVEPNVFMRTIMHILHDSFTGKWAALTVAKNGRSLLGKDLDLSVTPYLMESRPAWCQMSTTNGWFVNVFRLEYSADDPSASSDSERNTDDRRYPLPEIEL